MVWYSVAVLKETGLCCSPELCWRLPVSNKRCLLQHLILIHLQCGPQKSCKSAYLGCRETEHVRRHYWVENSMWTMQNECGGREKGNGEASEHQGTMKEWLERLCDAHQTLLLMWLVASFTFLSLHLMTFWRFIEMERVYEVPPRHFPLFCQETSFGSQLALFVSSPRQHFHWKVPDLSENSNLHHSFC